MTKAEAISLERFFKAVHSLRTTQTGWAQQTHQPSLDKLGETLLPFQILQKNTCDDPEASHAGLLPVFKEKMMWICVENSILPVESKRSTLVFNTEDGPVALRPDLKSFINCSL